MKLTTHRFTRMALIAAVYTVVSLLIAPLAFGPWQIRFSEALMLLCLSDMDNVCALTIGCFLTNLIGVMTGANTVGLMDIIFGTAATFIAGVLMQLTKNVKFGKWPVVAGLMPVIINGIIVGLEIAILDAGNTSAMLSSWLIYGLEVAAGEFLSCVVIGLPLWVLILKNRIYPNN